MYDVILGTLKSQNVSKNQFCKDVGISKAYINKVLGGGTPMSERLFTSILALSYFSDKAKEEITKERFESKHGENYELIQHFNEVAKEFESTLVPGVFEEIELTDESMVVTDKRMVGRLAYSLAKHCVKNGLTMYSNHTYAQKEIDNALYAAFYERDERQNDAALVHIIEKPHVFNKNYINCIWSALRYGTIKIKTLATEETITSTLLPYVMVCGEYALIWNEKCDCAYFICEYALGSAIKENFISLMKKSVVFTSYCEDEADIMTIKSSDSVNITVEKQTVICSIPGSCMGKTDAEILSLVARSELPKKTADFLIRSYMRYHRFQLESVKRHYVTSDSLIDFAKKGKYAVISHRYINDFSPPLRKRMFESLKAALEEEGNYIIDSSKVCFPLFLQINYCQEKTQIHYNSVYGKFGVYSASIFINYSDAAGSKKFFEALLAYQTNADALMTDAQVDYMIESMKLLCEG